MKISKRENSLIEVPDVVVEDFTKQMEENREYEKCYLFYKE